MSKLLSLGLTLMFLIHGVASMDYGEALTKSLLYFEAQRSGKLPLHQRVTWRGDSGLNDGNDARLLCLGVSLVFLIQEVAPVDYGEALVKSLWYFESQRSGKLPSNQRVTWRDDSGLMDGKDVEVDLVGGYYDAGDNVKFGFPMAFTTTMLAWGVVDFGRHMEVKNEIANAKEAIKWATDYMMKAHPEPNVLYGEVGDGNSDHECWQRPEDMNTSRTSYKIDVEHPGSDLAAETAAALAAASMVFAVSDSGYSSQLLEHARQLFDFALKNPGLYQESIPVAGNFYQSSGYTDELAWAGAWLNRATDEHYFLDAIATIPEMGGLRSMFSWDDKFVGAQVLIAKRVLDYDDQDYFPWVTAKGHADDFICSCIQKGRNNVKKTPGGLLWWDLPWNALQYTTTTSLVLTAYSHYLERAEEPMLCGGATVTADDLLAFAKSQVDYILGSNPKNMSYMVGYGTNYPKKVHHRGASIVSIKKDPAPVTCKGGYETWFNKTEPNPNVLDGAIVGGPNERDEYEDSRSNYQQTEPGTVNTAPLVGVLARLAVDSLPPN